MKSSYQLSPIKRIVLCTILCGFCQIWGTLETSIRGAILGGVIALFTPRALYNSEGKYPVLWQTLFFGVILGATAGLILWQSEPILQLASFKKPYNTHTKGAYTIVVAAAYGLAIHLSLFLGLHKKLSKQQIFLLIYFGSALSFAVKYPYSFLSMTYKGLLHPSLFAILWSLAMLCGKNKLPVATKPLSKSAKFITYWLPLLIVAVLIAYTFHDLMKR